MRLPSYIYVNTCAICGNFDDYIKKSQKKSSLKSKLTTNITTLREMIQKKIQIQKKNKIKSQI
jgi:hypothetical protein